MSSLRRYATGRSRSRGGNPSQEAPTPATTNPPSPPLSESNIEGDDDEYEDFNRRASVEGRYRVPRSEFYDDENGDTLLNGVVTRVQRGHTWIWFSGDDSARYAGRLEWLETICGIG